MVTASHNPMEFNGLKYKPDFGGSASPEVVAELEKNTASALSKGVIAMPFDATYNLRADFFGRFPICVCIAVNCKPGFAAEQLIYRHIGSFPFDIPECLIQSAEGIV